MIPLPEARPPLPPFTRESGGARDMAVARMNSKSTLAFGVVGTEPIQARFMS
jgi:hypothetical protein